MAGAAGRSPIDHFGAGTGPSRKHGKTGIGKRTRRQTGQGMG